MNEPTDWYGLSADLLPEYSAWAAVNAGCSLRRYAYPLVKLDHFLAVALMLWPEVIQHEGGLFLAAGFEASRFHEWSRATAGDLTAIEWVMNHRHVGDLLASLRDAPQPVLVGVGAVLRDCWEARLKQLYPQVPTRVEMVEPDGDVQVTFVTVRS